MANDFALHGAGRNQRAVRDHNERLILTMLNRQGPLPGSQIARRTGLSAQTVSNILRKLEAEALIRREDPLRGSVGKPGIPMGLNPEGALSLGLKIGRRSMELMLVTLTGDILDRQTRSYRYPLPGDVLDFVSSTLSDMTAPLDGDMRSRIAGIGVAMPSEIWTWPEAIAAARSDLLAWQGTAFRDDLAEITGLPVFIENDATSATRAEHAFGRGTGFRDYAYIYVGSFIGGGLVLDNAVFAGRNGNAGAFGSLPAMDQNGTAGQLIDTSSLYLLERVVERAGKNPDQICTDPLDWSGLQDQVSQWIDAIAPELVRAIVTIAAVIDIEAVLMDGAFPKDVRERLVDSVSATLPNADNRGIIVPKVLSGSIGAGARALGAASIPLVSLYMLGG